MSDDDEKWDGWWVVGQRLGRGFDKTLICAMRAKHEFTEYVLLSQEDEKIPDEELFRALDVHPEAFVERNDYPEGFIFVRTYTPF